MERDLRFKPETKYEYLATQELIDLWRTSQLNNPQRYFIYKEMKARNQCGSLVDKKQTLELSLMDAEFVILEHNEGIAPTVLKTVAYLLLFSPVVLPGLYGFIGEDILNQKINFGASLGVFLILQILFLMLWAAQAITANLLLTNKRLISFILLFTGVMKLKFTTHYFENNSILICAAKLDEAAYSNKDGQLCLTLLDLKRNKIERYCTVFKPGYMFFDSVLAVARANGCSIYISPVVVSKSKSSSADRNPVALCRFADCRPFDLYKWYIDLIRIEAAGVFVSPKHRYLLDLAQYFAGIDVGGKDHPDMPLSGYDVTRETLIAAMKCPYSWSGYNPKYMKITNKRIHLYNSKRKEVDCIQYASAKIDLSSEAIVLTGAQNVKLGLHFLCGNPILPVIDTYYLLGLSPAITEGEGSLCEYEINDGKRPLNMGEPVKALFAGLHVNWRKWVW